MTRDPKSSYYDAGGIEVQDYIKAKLTREQYIGFLLGNVHKYTGRMMHKDPEHPERDAEKADFYLNWLREELAKEKEFVPKPAGRGL